MDIFSILKEFGEINGLLIIVALIMFGWVWGLNKRIHKQHQEQLRDRQCEIDRLAADNHAYRDRFLAVLDKTLSYKPSEVDMWPLFHEFIMKGGKTDTQIPDDAEKQFDHSLTEVQRKDASWREAELKKAGKNPPNPILSNEENQQWVPLYF